MVAWLGRLVTLWQQLEFSGFPDHSLTPSHLKETLHTFSSALLRRFLYLATTHCHLPREYQHAASKLAAPHDRITIRKKQASPTEQIVALQSIGSLPTQYQVLIPDYNDAAVLQTQLLKAMAEVWAQA